ncbi:hypothetical protein ACKTEK_07865 [Tepidamorphus sp. 3E244]|uniref:hypothetical protein n=1 Tax=Tepidamorphus sp. 3E244 TaxID=3385498 RepID=UPI0038FCC6F8
MAVEIFGAQGKHVDVADNDGIVCLPAENSRVEQADALRLKGRMSVVERLEQVDRVSVCLQGTGNAVGNEDHPGLDAADLALGPAHEREEAEIVRIEVASDQARPDLHRVFASLAA